MKLQKLWNIDPGYFRLKQAAKTILAILIVLALMRNETLFIKLITALVSGFSMQGIVAKPFSLRILQVALLNSAFFLVFILGLTIRDCPNCTAVALVGLGFAANYVRRFGLQTSTAPMMIWTVCFLTTVLPFTDTLDVWNHLYSVITALFVSAFITLLIFPENYPRLFVNNANRLFHTLAKGMRESRRYVLHNHNRQTGVIDEKDLERLTLFRLKNTLNRLLESNQAIEQSDVFGHQAEKISDLLIEQYALVHVYTMMMDAYQALRRHQLTLPLPIRKKLGLIYKQFAAIFTSLEMNANYVVITNKSSTVRLPIVIAFEHPPLTEPAMVLILLNLNLSFNLLNRHLAKILARTTLP